MYISSLTPLKHVLGQLFCHSDVWPSLCRVIYVRSLTRGVCFHIHLLERESSPSLWILDAHVQPGIFWSHFGSQSWSNIEHKQDAECELEASGARTVCIPCENELHSGAEETYRSRNIFIFTRWGIFFFNEGEKVELVGKKNIWRGF